MRPYILHLGWYPGNYPKENNFAFHAVWEQALRGYMSKISCMFLAVTTVRVGGRSSQVFKTMP